MLFTSNLYLIFLLLVTVLYFNTPFRFRRLLLLLASLVFYMKWSAVLVTALLYVIILNYLAGLGIARFQDQARGKKAIVTAAVIGNLGLLFVFKYLDFFLGSLFWIAGAHDWTQYSLVLPVGISFYTFQGLSYTLDVYRGKWQAERSLLDVACYLSFFPVLLAGPIMRAPLLLPRLRQETRPDITRFIEGMLIIAGGLIKKVIIADMLAQYVDQVYAATEAFSGATRLAASFAYTLQIYCDFAGYSDVAIGSAKILGIDLIVNFDAPYLADSMRDFWRRWHIGLSTWLRDYLYISLGGNRQSPGRTYVNLFLTMLLGGLWHGANYTFLIWGGLHGLFLAAERWWLDRRGGQKCQGMGCLFLRWLLVLNIVNLLWIFFRAPDIAAVSHIITGVLTWAPGKSLGIYPLFILGLYLVFELLNQRLPLKPWLMGRPMLARWVAYLVLVLMMIIFSGSRGQEFIYFQF